MPAEAEQQIKFEAGESHERPPADHIAGDDLDRDANPRSGVSRRNVLPARRLRAAA